MVDIFIKSEKVLPVVMMLLSIKPKTIWLQIGVINQNAETKVKNANINFVMDRCPKIEYARLNGELGWGGINSGIISSKKLTCEYNEKKITVLLPKLYTQEQVQNLLQGQEMFLFIKQLHMYLIILNMQNVFLVLQDFGFIYSRLTNPTVSVLEERISSIEKIRNAVAFIWTRVSTISFYSITE